jgi:hypothetical protein
MAELHARAVDAVRERVLAAEAVKLLTEDGSCSVEFSKGRAWAGDGFGFAQRDVKVHFTARTKDELDALSWAAHEVLIGEPPAGPRAVQAVCTDTGKAAGDDEAGWTRTDLYGVHVPVGRRPVDDVMAKARAAKRAADKAGGE